MWMTSGERSIKFKIYSRHRPQARPECLIASRLVSLQQLWHSLPHLFHLPIPEIESRRILDNEANILVYK